MVRLVLRFWRGLAGGLCVLLYYVMGIADMPNFGIVPKIEVAEFGFVIPPEGVGVLGNSNTEDGEGPLFKVFDILGRQRRSGLRSAESRRAWGNITPRKRSVFPSPLEFLPQTGESVFEKDEQLFPTRLRRTKHGHFDLVYNLNSWGPADVPKENIHRNKLIVRRWRFHELGSVSDYVGTLVDLERSLRRFKRRVGNIGSVNCSIGTKLGCLGGLLGFTPLQSSECCVADQNQKTDAFQPKPGWLIPTLAFLAFIVGGSMAVSGWWKLRFCRSGRDLTVGVLGLLFGWLIGSVGFGVFLTHLSVSL